MNESGIDLGFDLSALAEYDFDLDSCNFDIPPSQNYYELKSTHVPPTEW